MELISLDLFFLSSYALTFFRLASHSRLPYTVCLYCKHGWTCTLKLPLYILFITQVEMQRLLTFRSLDEKQWATFKNSGFYESITFRLYG